MLARSTIRLWRARGLVLGFFGLLAACQHGGSAGTAETKAPPGTWSVVEQVGEVRVRAPSAVHGSPLAAMRSLPAGTRVSTGAHAGLILRRADSQLVAGPGSVFDLPATATTPLLQHEGTVRYRATAAPWISVQAGGLTLTAEDAVFTLAARREATELEVEAGEVRINTRDARARRLGAGQRYLLPASMVRPPARVENTPSAEPAEPVLAPVEAQPADAVPPPRDEPDTEPASVVALDQAMPGAAGTFAPLVRGLLAGVAEAQLAHPTGAVSPGAL